MSGWWVAARRHTMPTAIVHSFLSSKQSFLNPLTAPLPTRIGHNSVLWQALATLLKPTVPHLELVRGTASARCQETAAAKAPRSSLKLISSGLASQRKTTMQGRNQNSQLSLKQRFASRKLDCCPSHLLQQTYGHLPASVATACLQHRVVMNGVDFHRLLPGS